MRLNLSLVSAFVLGMGVSGGLFYAFSDTRPTMTAQAAAVAPPRLQIEAPQVAALSTPTPPQSPAPQVEAAAFEIPETVPSAEEAAAAQVEPESTVERRMVEVGKGDTLLDVLIDAEVPVQEAHSAIEALRDVYNPRTLRAGQKIALVFERGGDVPQFLSLELEPDVTRSVGVARGDGGFQATETKKALERREVFAAGRIDSSLYEAGASMGVSPAVLANLIRAYSYDVDFQRDIQPGDAFEVFYQRDFDESGEPVRSGEILYASMTTGGKQIKIYRFETADGIVDFYTPKGASVRKALLRTPVDGARLSSRFGMRKHPILGYSRLHAGIDFAAPTGTPIYAAGDGVVDVAGRNGGYGNYVRLRHNSLTSTAYAHMSKIAVKKGARVKQGDVIGYVGSTGQSTGPHLHYEVLENGKQVNPLSVKAPTGRVLDNKELKAFQAHVAALDRKVAAQVQAPQVAASPAKVAPASCASGC